MGRRRVLFLAIVAAVLIWITWPSEGQVDIESCSPKGMVASLSAAVWGQTFWRAQLEYLDRNARLAEGEDPLAAMIASANAAKRKSDAQMQELYKQYPELAPTPAQEAAQRLRDRADEIEMDEVSRKSREANRSIAVKSRNCQHIVAEKLKHI